MEYKGNNMKSPFKSIKKDIKMNNNKLYRIKAIKEELAILEEELLKEGEPKEQEFEYPIYKQSTRFKQIVKFIGLEEGLIVYKGVYSQNVGYTSTNWTSHTDTDTWKDVPFDEERGFFNKQLIWCWDNGNTHVRALRFYDAKNKCAFSGYGKSSWYGYSNYEPYEGTWPEWAVEAYKTLED